MEPSSFHDWREWRRFRAVQLARLGWVHRDIADALGISESAVSQWLAHFASEGVQGVLSHPHGHAVEHRHYVTDVHATIMHLLGLDSRRLEIPGRVRLEIDHGTPIGQILA